MAKSEEAFRNISEVAEWLETPAHVLRFWESKFAQIKPVKGAGGRRYYRPEDMALLAGIKTLLHGQGLTIKGAQKLLREKGVGHIIAIGKGEAEPDLTPAPPARRKSAPVQAEPQNTAKKAPARMPSTEEVAPEVPEVVAPELPFAPTDEPAPDSDSLTASLTAPERNASGDEVQDIPSATLKAAAEVASPAEAPLVAPASEPESEPESEDDFASPAEAAEDSALAHDEPPADLPVADPLKDKSQDASPVEATDPDPEPAAPESLPAALAMDPPDPEPAPARSFGRFTAPIAIPSESQPRLAALVKELRLLQDRMG